MKIRSGFEGYIQSGSEIGRGALMAVGCLLRELFRESVQAVTRITNRKTKNNHDEKNDVAGRIDDCDRQCKCTDRI